MVNSPRGRPTIKEADKLEVISIRLHRGLIKKIRAYAEKNRRTVADSIRILIEDGL